VKKPRPNRLPITTTELRLLRRWMRKPHTPLRFADGLGRFKRPILDCCARINLNRQKRFALVRFVFSHMAILAILEKPYWQWTA
jgi:hypothetical protein